MNIISVRNLSKIYNKGENEVKAVDDISFDIEKGEHIAVIGTSGSGKSTLLHLLGGLDKPTEGKVIIDGEDITCFKDEKLSRIRRRKIGFVFQSYNLIPVLTVRENIEMPVLLDGLKPDKAHIDELIEVLGLSDRENHLPSQLSGGQQQRESIARALANKPSIILADEPTGNLDKQNGIEVCKLLKTTADHYEQTLVIITHDLSIANMADRVLRISDGKLLEQKG